MKNFKLYYQKQFISNDVGGIKDYYYGTVTGKIIKSDEYSEILSSTIFLPCPNGTVHPESYRLYEALECGCIPIVENSYRYFDRAYPNNPFIKVDKWADAKKLINFSNENQIKEKQKECNLWWMKYKRNLKESILEKVNL